MLRSFALILVPKIIVDLIFDQFLYRFTHLRRILQPLSPVPSNSLTNVALSKGP
jgi:hypothetical protein